MNLREFNRATGERRLSIDSNRSIEEQLANMKPVRRSVLLANSVGNQAHLLRSTPSTCSTMLRASSPLTASLPNLDPLSTLSPVHAYQSPTSQSFGHLNDNNNDLSYADQNANHMMPVDDYPIKPHVSLLDRSARVRLHPPAVDVQNVSLIYGKGAQEVQVLRNLHMQVDVGCIFALLGSSGCGKTSLLKIILNQKRQTSGCIRLYGYRTGQRKSGVPGNGVGYMPQELALCGELSIQEMLFYFGSVGLLNRRQIDERIQNLHEELQLPPLNQVIDTLSGGQKRRVSLSIALLLQSRLLVLDEPTVGVDPLLRAHIWEMLRNRAESGCTVLITTHYVEEARGANVVGFLRDGHLLAQGSPQELQTKLNCDTLEHVFHRLCLQQHRTAKTTEDNSLTRGAIRSKGEFDADNTLNEAKEQELQQQQQQNNQSNQQQQFKHQLHQMKQKSLQVSQQPLLIDKLPFHEPSELGVIGCWWKRQSAVTRNCWMLNLRRPGTIIAQYLLPILTTMLFCVCIGSTPNGIRIGVITEEVCNIQQNILHEKPIVTGWESNLIVDPIVGFPKFLHQLVGNWSHATSASILSRVKRQTDTDDAKHSGLLTLNDSLSTSNQTTRLTNESIDNSQTSTETPLTSRMTTVSSEEENDEIVTEAPPILYNEFKEACFSELFLQQVDSFVFDVKRFTSESDALKQTRQGKLWGYVKISRDFSRATLARLFFTDYAADIALADAQIIIHADLTNRVLLDTVQRSFRHSYHQFALKAIERANQLVAANSSSSHLKKGLSSLNATLDESKELLRVRRANEPKVSTLNNNEDDEEVKSKEEEGEEEEEVTVRFNPHMSRSPIEQQESVFGSDKALSDFFGVRDFAAPGVLTVVAFSISFALTAFDLVIELEGHMLQRHLTAGVTNLQFVLGHCAARLPFTCTSGPLLLALCVYTFDVPCRGSFVVSALLLVLQSICGMCQALLVSALCPNAAVCAAVSNGFLVLLFIISGVFWSVETLPMALRWFSRIQPTSIPCETLRALLARGVFTSDPIVLLGFQITLAWSLFYFLAAVFVFYKRTSR